MLEQHRARRSAPPRTNAAEVVDAFVAANIAAAPPLTDEQAARIAVMLREPLDREGARP